jgi:hypothetical protein
MSTLDKQRIWAIDLVSEVTQALKALRVKLDDLRFDMGEPR